MHGLLQVCDEPARDTVLSEGCPGAQRLSSFLVEHAVELREESVDERVGVGAHRGQEVGHPATRVEAAEHRAGTARRHGGGIAGEAVDHVRDVLPLQDLLGGEEGGGRANVALDHRRRVVQFGQVFAAAADECENE